MRLERLRGYFSNDSSATVPRGTDTYRGKCTWQRRPSLATLVSRGTPRSHGSALLAARSLLFHVERTDIIVCPIMGAKPSFVSRETAPAKPESTSLLVDCGCGNRRIEQVAFCRRRKTWEESCSGEHGEPHGCYTWNEGRQINLQKRRTRAIQSDICSMQRAEMNREFGF
jgi:hypothetical protein